LNRDGGTSLDAVEAAIRILEDDPLFNAGKGAAFARDGRIELDAALMDGRDRRAGGVAGLTTVKNPISAARAVMERSGHVLMAGPGAEQFAREEGLDVVDPDYFRTPERWDALQAKLRHDGGRPTGTVGAVALDRQGHLAAGASTGGTTGKRPGRVGDSPVVGAGIYAEDEICAVSCTGDGEFFLRLAVAHEIVALVKHRGLSIRDAGDRVIRDELTKLGGEGGALVLAPDGSYTLPFNSPGMFRGTIAADGTTRVAIYDEPWEA
jgi:beta-aspartyl-peptidase (threonine type)